MRNFKRMAKVFADCNNIYDDDKCCLNFRGEFEDFESFRKTLLTSVRRYNNFNARDVLYTLRNIIKDAKGKIEIALAREHSVAIYFKVSNIEDMDLLFNILWYDEHIIESNILRLWWD